MRYSNGIPRSKKTDQHVGSHPADRHLAEFAFYRRQMDVIAQRAVERLVRINATVFDASSEAIVITDTKANIISVNTAFTKSPATRLKCGVATHVLLSSGLQEKSFYTDMWSTLLATGQWRGEVTNHRKDGTPFEAHLSIGTSRDSLGHLRHFVGVMTDITESKRVRLARDEALNRLKRIASRVPGVLYEFGCGPTAAARSVCQRRDDSDVWQPDQPG